MKMLQKSLVVLAVVILADLLLIACYKSKDIKYRYEAVNLEIMDDDSLTNRYTAIDNDSVPFTNLFLDAHFQSQKVAMADFPAPMLLGSAMAFSPNEDNYFNTSRLSKIQLHTVNNYNGNFSSGEEITSMCLFGMESHLSETTNAEGLVKKYNSYLESIDGNREHIIPGGLFWVKLKERPAAKTPQKFAITIEMQDGTVLRDSSLSVIIY